ncbi:MAG: nitroreductase family protein [Bacillota bacterium]|nr:nitroreductase family protein [Bacillota bacterium]
MEIYEAIEKRRTVRGFKEKVSEETLKKMITAGTKALSAGNSQPWEFIIIDDQKLLEEIGENKYQQNRSLVAKDEKAKAAIEAAALVQKKSYQNCSAIAVCFKEGHNQVASAWSCIQNMALAATAEGVGVVTSSFWGEHQKIVERLLGLPEGYKVATVMLVGMQDGPPNEKILRPESSLVHRNKFGIQKI